MINTNIDIKIQDGKYILVLRKDQPNWASRLSEFEKLPSPIKGLSRYVELEGELKSITKFKQALRQVTQKPQAPSSQSTLELQKALEEGFGGIEAMLGDILLELKKINNRDATESNLRQLPAPAKSEKRNNPEQQQERHRALKSWFARLKKKDPKITKINEILALGGIKIGSVDVMASYTKTQLEPGTTYSVVKIEKLYDEHGAETLQKIVTTLSLMPELVPIRRDHWEAMEYALLSAPGSVRVKEDELYYRAHDAFAPGFDDWVEYRNRIKVLSKEYRIPNYLALGKMITGELPIAYKQL